MEMQDFKGVWVPKEICNLDNLTWTEKIILSEILVLSKQSKCYANNEHFSKLLKVRKDSISRIIGKLVKQGCLISEIKYKPEKKQVQQRILKLNSKFFADKTGISARLNANTSLRKCQSPLGIEPDTLSAQMPNIEYNIEYNKENNIIYAQNRKAEEENPKKSKSENLESEEPIERRFERFYKIYPKKKSKGGAFNWFKRHNPGSPLVDTMIESIKRQKQTIAWQKENGRYIPYPATWLNARGWENEIDPREIADLSENSASRVLAIELYETLKRKEFALNADAQKLVKSWAIDVEEYLSFERTREREDRIFYAIKAIEKSDKWRKIIVDAKSLIKNIEFIKE